MAKLEITLHQKGGDVTYKQNHITGQKYLDFWNIQEKIEKES
ncbi:phage tail assembly chaperone G, partial [Lactococcus lactis]